MEWMMLSIAPSQYNLNQTNKLPIKRKILNNTL